jgi:hypothetical protein
MPLDAEFKQHLRSISMEVYEATVNECVQHKNELLFKARATHNSAATPIAYSDAALYAMEFRLRKTIEKYIDAVVAWGYPIDDAFEREMVKEFWSLTAGPNQIQLPPMVRGPQIPAVQADYGRKRSRLAHQLVREGSNRLKELKMKTKRQQLQQPAVSHATNNFNVSAQNAFINSPHSSVVQNSNNITINTQILDDIDRLSEGNAELQSAVSELRTAHAQGGNVVDKLQKWMTLANAATSLAGTIHQHYPRLVALIEQLKHLGGK